VAFNPEKANKSFRKLSKSLRAISKQPTPAQVHDLRTRTRRVEAIVHALMLDQERKGKDLVKAMAPIRKMAGKVRDMDVLIGFTATLSSTGEEECLVQLIEHLGSRRLKSVRKLRHAFAAHRKQARRCIQRCSGLLKKRRKDSQHSDAANRAAAADATATALAIWSELTNWPPLSQSNLHPFRLKVKELRYILQFGEEKNLKFVQTLGKVKDAVGEWHDWNELANIAASVLGNRSPLMRQIRSTTRAKFDSALSVANAMRNQYQGSGSARKFILLDRSESIRA
jgi:CHAD domain-containing protein